MILLKTPREFIIRLLRCVSDIVAHFHYSLGKLTVHLHKLNWRVAMIHINDRGNILLPFVKRVSVSKDVTIFASLEVLFVVI